MMEYIEIKNSKVRMNVLQLKSTCVDSKIKSLDYCSVITFFPRITAPGSPWITMYFVPPIYKPVGARVPGSAKSVIMAVISSGLNCNTSQTQNQSDNHYSPLI